MLIIPYPSIDKGFLYSARDKLDCIISDFYESEYSQSYLFHGSISSFPYILQQHADSPEDVVNSLQSTLRTLLLKYFDDCQVEASIIPSESQTSYDIRLMLEVRQGETNIRLGDIMKIRDSRFNKSLSTRE